MTFIVDVSGMQGCGLTCYGELLSINTGTHQILILCYIVCLLIPPLKRADQPAPVLHRWRGGAVGGTAGSTTSHFGIQARNQQRRPKSLCLAAIKVQYADPSREGKGTVPSLGRCLYRCT